MQKGYGNECDWWSLGAIMFECLVGYPPFCSESTHETYQKILQWQRYLVFPDDVHLSREAEDLIRRLARTSFPRRRQCSCFLPFNPPPRGTLLSRLMFQADHLP